MDPTGIIYLSAVGITYAVYARRKPQQTKQAVEAGARSLRAMVPTFIAVFGLVGMFDVFIPAELVEKWMGATGGALSLVIGTGLGTIATGPPAAAFPLAASLLDNGAWMPAVAAFIVSWILVGFVSLPMEAKIFGGRFALLRNGLSIVVATTIGVLMGVLL